MTDQEIYVRLNACRDLNPYPIDWNSHSLWRCGFLSGARNEPIDPGKTQAFRVGWQCGRSWQKQVFPHYE